MILVIGMLDSTIRCNTAKKNSYFSFVLSNEFNFEVANTFIVFISAQVDSERIMVVGDGIDSKALTVMLRKKIGYAQ